jgi:heme exporter protein D
MQMAFVWLCEGTFMLAMAVVTWSLVTRWRNCLRNVMLYPGRSAKGAYVSLRAMPVAVAIGLAGVIVVGTGFASVGSALITASCLVMFASACGVGMTLPNLGVERAHSHEWN